MKPIIIVAFAGCFIVSLSFPASIEAKSFRDRVKQATKGAVKIVTKTVPAVVAPGTVIAYKVFRGEKPKDAVKDVAGTHVDILVKPLEVQAGIEQKFEDELRKQSKLLGKGVELVRLPEKLQRQAIITTAKATPPAVLDGRPGDVVGIPLATAIHQAIRQYKSRAKPMPERMRFLLSTAFTPEVLASVRYTVDKNPGSIAGILNSLLERTADNHAVTVGNIIVFAKEPSDTDVWFWAHENSTCSSIQAAWH